MAYKIIQWSSGNVGKNAIATVAQRKGLKLVGLYVYQPEKVGEDAGSIAGILQKGTVAGQFWEWAGMVNNRKVIVHETVWRMHDSVGNKWPRGNHSITIKGKPDMYVDFGAGWNSDVLLSTAVHAVNAVPYLCDAPAGVRSFLDLPMIMARQ